MYNIMNNSITGMSANQGKIDIISNNIANSQTVGYKKLDSGFLDLYTDTLSRQSYPHNGDNLITGTGVKLSSATRNLTQGALKETGINTEIAIDGDGFRGQSIHYLHCGRNCRADELRNSKGSETGKRAGQQ